MGCGSSVPISRTQTGTAINPRGVLLEESAATGSEEDNVAGTSQLAAASQAKMLVGTASPGQSAENLTNGILRKAGEQPAYRLDSEAGMITAELPQAVTALTSPVTMTKLRQVRSRDDLVGSFHKRERAAEKLKKQKAADWLPEYKPTSIVPPAASKDAVVQKTTKISIPMITETHAVARKTKIVCTLGPSCWSEEGLAELIDAGCNVMRFNFSHGSHEAHQQVLDRVRKVAAAKGSYVATMLDTKGPEIRTAMLQGGKSIELQAGQEVIIVAVGDAYTTWEGGYDPAIGKVKIGLSYSKLCQSVKPGNTILMADGSVSLQVVEVLSDTELRAKALNSKVLGQRKNVNLPGVHVDLPVLGEQDIKDVQEFACRNKMDFIAASFVQTAEDVKFIRRVLEDAAGYNIKIISKIESQAGLQHYDSILDVTDGIMVARGDLAMEIPSQKVALAQKMCITKANIAGKMVITATQMLESMIESPLPTRAEMTDVANAVFDGTDAVMLSGETANGQFPHAAVRTMAAIAANAELGVDYSSRYDFIRFNNAGKEPVSPDEATLSGVAKAAMDFCLDRDGDGVVDITEDCLALVLTSSGRASAMVAKYRPPCPVVVVSANDDVLRQASAVYGLYPCKVDNLDKVSPAIKAGVAHAIQLGLTSKGHRVIIATGAAEGGSADNSPEVSVDCIGVQRMTMLEAPQAMAYRSPFEGNSTICSQTLCIGLPLITDKVFNHRSTKVIATMGPSCWEPEKMRALLDAGISVARFDLSVGDLAHTQQMLDRFRQVCAHKVAASLSQITLPYTPTWATMVSIKGPEIRTAMLLGNRPIQLVAGQDVTLVAVGEQYTTWEGFKDEATGETRIGISYSGLCQAVHPGSIILLGNGAGKLQVTEITSDTELRAKVLNTKKLGEQRPVHLPGVRLAAPLLAEHDLAGLRFAASNKVDIVMAPFVRGPEDVQLVRKMLDDFGGENVQVFAQIDTAAGIEAFDSILEEADGVVVNRGNLGLHIEAEKVCLAQKWLAAKANLAGKPIIMASQILESMIDNPRPTRAEMTDVGNAVFDGFDGIMLVMETCLGQFPELAAATAANILSDCEVGVDHYAGFNSIRNFTPKPMPTVESVCSSAVKAAIDMGAALITVFTNTLLPVQLLRKYRPPVAMLVVTTSHSVAQQANAIYSCVPFLLSDKEGSLEQAKKQAVEFAKLQGLAEFCEGDKAGDQLLVVTGPPNHPFISDEDLAEVEFFAEVLGDETYKLVAPSAYTGEDTIAYRSTRVGLDLCCEPISAPRKTKVVCTLGPSCWSEEGLAGLLDAGCDIARFNFSHGSHEGHLEVLNRLRKVAADKGRTIATMLDTKGPEIRTAMLKDHSPVEIQADSEVILVAVGEAYTTWEGGLDPATGRVKIGISYERLCRDLGPGMRVLIADGSLAVEVIAVTSDTEILGKALNHKKLGERKNVNLPGVRVQLPVLTPKDIQDVQEFACKHGMDIVAASFVQSADDVRLIRKVLAEAGGADIKIVSKIESSHGLINYDEILAETDGIMVARGDLAMEIPSQKVALAQKMCITKANIAGKAVITATQMLESMTASPLPTRAEMTDVANAVFDGTDCVMLSGETANGQFPNEAVRTMCAIAANAEVGTNYYQVYDYIRDFSSKPMCTMEAVVSAAAKDVLDLDASLILVVTTTGVPAHLITKYRPKVPVLVVTPSESVARQCGLHYALHPYVVPALPASRQDVEFDVLLEEALLVAVERQLLRPGGEVVVIHGYKGAAAEQCPMLTIKVASGRSQPYVPSKDVTKTLSLRTTAISMADVLESTNLPRKTKVVCTLGPSCWSEEGLAGLLDAGCDIARFNFSHGSHEGHQQVLDRLRKVAADKGRTIATMLDTKGPEIRTAMLQGGKDIELHAGQQIILVAVGSAYDTWEGGLDEARGMVKIGISYDKLCSSVREGNMIKIADGSLSVEVEEVLSTTELRARCLNHKVLGQRKNVNLPGVHVDIPVLTAKDIDDLQNFCCKNKMDFVAASFVQTQQDVRTIRRVLDEAGGQQVQIISKIENEAGLENFDDILKATDGIMVARGDLAMEIPSQKVALAQKMCITKANIAGKAVITATQMLESMTASPLPTRAEMTDVANAVFDGTDAVMLSGETANGQFPLAAVRTMAAIAANAEGSNSYYSSGCFINDHSPKPCSRLEATCAGLAAAVIDCNAQIIITITTFGAPARMVSKYRPPVPQIVVTADPTVARQTRVCFGQFALLVEGGLGLDVDELVQKAKAYALSKKIWNGKGTGLMLHGRSEPAADLQPVYRAFELMPQSRVSLRSFSLGV